MLKNFRESCVLIRINVVWVIHLRFLGVWSLESIKSLILVEALERIHTMLHLALMRSEYLIFWTEDSDEYISSKGVYYVIKDINNKVWKINFGEFGSG